MLCSYFLCKLQGSARSLTITRAIGHVQEIFFPQVRTNAALALGTPPCYGLPGQLQQVWAAVVTGLDASDTQVDFAEYRQAQSLKEEVPQP